MNMFVDPSIKQEDDVYIKLYNIYKKYKKQSIRKCANKNENIPQKIIYGFQIR